MAFEVNDGIAGFPASAIEHTPQVEMKVEDGSLRIRSARTASCYLGDHAPILKGADGWVDTGDLFDLRDGRFYFVGRRDGMINVGGSKVYPEEIEAVINRHPAVHTSLVQPVPQLYGTTHSLFSHLLPSQGVSVRFAESDCAGPGKTD